MIRPPKPTKWDYFLALLVFGIFVTLCLSGCSPVVTVRRDGALGRATRAYVTVAHVASSSPVYVRDRWYEGDILCDPIETVMGPRRDRVTILMPRADYRAKRGPGDSGSPVADADGKVIGIYRGAAVSRLGGK